MLCFERLSIVTSLWLLGVRSKCGFKNWWTTILLMCELLVIALHVFIDSNRNISLSEDLWLCPSLHTHGTKDGLGTPSCGWQHSIVPLGSVLWMHEPQKIPSVLCRWTFNLVSLEINCLHCYARWLSFHAIPTPSVDGCVPSFQLYQQFPCLYWCTFSQGPLSGLSQQGVQCWMFKFSWNNKRDILLNIEMCMEGVRFLIEMEIPIDPVVTAATVFRESWVLEVEESISMWCKLLSCFFLIYLFLYFGVYFHKLEKWVSSALRVSLLIAERGQNFWVLLTEIEPSFCMHLSTGKQLALPSRFRAFLESV